MVSAMFIRRTQTRRTEDGKPYFSHRLVHAERLGSSVRQRTLLNLGRHFDIPQADWPLLCARINDALSGQAPLVADCPPAVEEEAQRIAAQLIARGAAAPTAGLTDVQPVDVDSLRLVRPRSVGVEQVGLWALEQLDLPALLTRLGVNGALRSAATGAIVGRLAAPASERATHRWLQERSGLGELLGVDFETVGAMQLYRASDVLVKHREAIEAHLFDRAMGLFDLQPTVTLYDLTNTYFEGEASDQPQAQRGHSKEKRSDCPLLTLGLMLDASGFVRRSKVFAGNVREHRTLAGMLEALEAPVGALVVMDRGVATDACVTWLRDNGYRYLVVSRERHRRFDADAAVSLQTQSDQTVHMHKVVSTDPDEVRLYCYSEERAEKERGIVERFASRFETALTKLNDGLSRPRAHKRLDQVWQRIGRLKAKHSRVASHYQITVTANEAGDQAVAVNWTRRPQDGSMVTHPGVYCLRSSETDWNEDALWRTYTTLTDVEAVFRSLKSELGLRPIYHRKPARADGHLFITVIAYQLVQVIRTRLRARREHARWTTLRRVLEGQQRVTATFRRPDGRTLHVRTPRKTARAMRVHQGGRRAASPGRLGRVNTIGRIVVSFLDGAHRNAVRTHRVLSPATAWQCQHAQSAGAQRDPVRRRAGVQVARVAEALWELAHDLHPHESLVQERGARPGLRTPATRPVDPHQVGGGVAGQHHRQGPSRRHGGSKKNGPQAIGKSRGGWTTKIHLVAADARMALTFALSPGQAHDGPEGRKLLTSLGPQDAELALVMDRAYQGDETRQLALDLGFTPVVPPIKTRTDPWEYDREMYKRRNEVERLFRRLKGYRRIFSRFEKLDVMFIGFIHFVLMFDALRQC